MLTLKNYKKFNPVSEAIILKDALSQKNWETFINILPIRTNSQLQQIREEFRKLSPGGQDLESELEKAFTHDNKEDKNWGIKSIKNERKYKSLLKLTLETLFYTPLENDVMRFAITFEKAKRKLPFDLDYFALIFGTYSQDEILKIKNYYEKTFPCESFIDNIKLFSNGPFKQLLLSLLLNQRSTNTQSLFYDRDLYINLLIKEERFKRREDRCDLYFNLFSKKPLALLREIVINYKEVAEKDIFDAINYTFGKSDSTSCLMAFINNLLNPSKVFLHKIINSFSSKTSNEDMMKYIVLRREKDLSMIKSIYQEEYNRNMVDDILTHIKENNFGKKEGNDLEGMHKIFYNLMERLLTIKLD